ncbi:MAG TPA: HesA/MoeB/ThiF family protein [Saprospiraceae bacterium]|nr:HesA/MoeB/ThiF family protein [Saprospiraceae bacterium]
MTADEHARYACQMVLPAFGEAAQTRLKAARVLIVGMGGLGCPAAQYLVAAGVGRVTLADYDTVSASNLHRQVLYTPADVGLLKAQVAAQRLSAQNPHVQVRALTEKISPANALAALAGHDLVLDCSDNFETRYLLNDAALLSGLPCVYGAIYQYEGQVALWNAPQPDGSRSPHYRDLYPSVDAAQIPSCTEGGVLPALAGIIGCLQASEALKYLAGIGDAQAGRLLVFDALTLSLRGFRLGSHSRVAVTHLPQAAEVPLLTPAAWAASAPHAYCVVDVRSAHERATRPLEALHLPLAEMAARWAEIPTERPLLFCCASGRRSAQAVLMWKHLCPQVPAFSLENGLNALT